MQSAYQQPPPGPQPSGALAIIGFIVGIVAFLCGWIPFVGLVLGVVGLLLSILAVRKLILRGLAVTGIVLSTIAALTSLVTTGLFVIAMIGSSGSAPDAGPEVAAASHAPEDFVEIDERELANITKDPDAHAGETLVLYGYVTQFDADSGPCRMRVNVAAEQKSAWYEYEHNSLAYGGDGESECPELEDVVADDEVKLTVVLQGGESYNSLGGYTTVPYFEVIEAEVL